MQHGIILEDVSERMKKERLQLQKTIELGENMSLDQLAKKIEELDDIHDCLLDIYQKAFECRPIIVDIKTEYDKK